MTFSLFGLVLVLFKKLKNYNVANRSLDKRCWGINMTKKCELENRHNFIRFYTSLFHIIQYCISEITMSYIPKFYWVWGKVLLIVYCTHFFHWYMQLVLRWMDPQQHQDCRLRHPTPWFENGCYFYWKHNCHSRIVQAHQRTIHRYVQAQGNKIIEWDFFLSRAFLYCV